jgi:hypothetical protein
VICDQFGVLIALARRATHRVGLTVILTELASSIEFSILFPTVLIPFRADGDSDEYRQENIDRFVIGEVLIPFRADGDSDLTAITPSSFLLRKGLNTLSG